MAGLDGRKFSPHRDQIPGPSSPQSVAIPTEITRLRINVLRKNCAPSWFYLQSYTETHSKQNIKLRNNNLVLHSPKYFLTTQFFIRPTASPQLSFSFAQMHPHNSVFHSPNCIPTTQFFIRPTASSQLSFSFAQLHQHNSVFHSPNYILTTQVFIRPTESSQLNFSFAQLNPHN